MNLARVTTALVAALCLTGCLERRERITVDPDGTVTIEATFDTQSEGELLEGDALPSLAGGWFVEESSDVDDEGKRRFHVTAEAIFPAEFDLPENYAVVGDPQADLYLQFPTTVTIEDRRRDGIYYHFHRKYPARPWAYIHALEELLVTEQTKELADKPEEELTREDRELQIKAYIDFEAAKMMAFARAAYLQITPDAPQDGWLGVHESIEAFKSAFDYDRVARIFELNDEEARADALEDEAERWHDDSAKRLQEALREHCHYSGVRMTEFLQLYERKKRFFDITAELGDDAFEITVVMPGRVIGSNADLTSDNEATWRFSGERFRDRGVELMVSSRMDP